MITRRRYIPASWTILGSTAIPYMHISSSSPIHLPGLGTLARDAPEPHAEVFYPEGCVSVFAQKPCGRELKTPDLWA